MFYKRALLVSLAMLACFTTGVLGACNNLKKSPGAICCPGSVVGTVCADSLTGIKGFCAKPPPLSELANNRPNALYCKFRKCDRNFMCFDYNPCTTDSCVNGLCARALVPGCTTCYPPGSVTKRCDDGNKCTADSCDGQGKCQHIPAPGCVPPP